MSEEISFDAWNARLNARSPVVSRRRVWDGHPTHSTGSLLSFWGRSMRKPVRTTQYRPKPVLERVERQRGYVS